MMLDATFRDPLELASPNNPSAVACSADPAQTCIDVRPGDQLPGIPAHRVKAGADATLTPQWKVGGDLIWSSGQYFLGGTSLVDLRTTYDVTTGVQLYGTVQNLLDRRYGTSGTYFNLAAANAASAATATSFPDPRTITPAQPFAAYAGVRVRF